MRITGGKARGIPLKAPKGEATRPATDRLREAVFSSLGPSVEGRRVADLFAGTGSYGLEALSRGARNVVFFENDRAALACLRQNVQSALRSLQSKTSSARIVPQDVFTLKSPQPGFDLIFLDPPYAMVASELARIFESVIGPLALDPAKVIVELPGNLSPEIPGWQILRRIGKSGRDKPSALLYHKTIKDQS
jgi:16S rRNA (guanine966-N2)-methyltransferase